MFTYYWKAWVVRNTPLQVLDVRVTSGEKAGLTERCSTDVDTYTLCTSVCLYICLNLLHAREQNHYRYWFSVAIPAVPY